jgi:hypothetical protein
MSVLITGANGHVGLIVATYLIENNLPTGFCNAGWFTSAWTGAGAPLAACPSDLRLLGIADAAPSKIGKFLPTGGVPIISPRELRRSSPDAIVVFAWNSIAEIAPSLTGYDIWVPIPRLERVA